MWVHLVDLHHFWHKTCASIIVQGEELALLRSGHHLKVKSTHKNKPQMCKIFMNTRYVSVTIDGSIIYNQQSLCTSCSRRGFSTRYPQYNRYIELIQAASYCRN
jgi:hypothetical protein